MPEQRYKRPPITEAVIEVRLGAPLCPPDLEGVSRDFMSNYPGVETQQNYGLEFDLDFGHQPGKPEPVSRVANHSIGYRRSSADVTELLVLWPHSFTVAQLAPYPGWDSFFARFQRDWKTWKRTVGYRKIIRLGVRFINRIDVPVSEDGLIHESDYLAVYPVIPATLGAMTNYAAQILVPIREIRCNLVINSAAIPSPLLGHGAVLLDLDFGTDVDVPQHDDDLYEFINSVRAKKNEVFEACITDRARDLFRQ